VLKEVAEMEPINEGGASTAVFTPDEWWMLRRAMFGSAASVAMARRRNDYMIPAMFAVTQQLLAARTGNTSQLVRELANFWHFETGLLPGMSRADEDAWLTSRLNAIRSAISSVAAKAPADAAAFREFLLNLAYAAVATRRWVSGAEARAIARVEEALAG
jgi:hypothetical protein